MQRNARMSSLCSSDQSCLVSFEVVFHRLDSACLCAHPLLSQLIHDSVVDEPDPETHYFDKGTLRLPDLALG
jgi:hypothetical protein